MRSQRSAIGTLAALPPTSLPPGSMPPPQGQAAPRSQATAWHLSAAGFSLGILLISLYLQRFGFTAGSGPKISVATPLGFLLIIWGLASGSLAFDRRRTALMLGLGAVALMAYNFQVNMPLAMAPRSSLISALYWLAVTSFAALRFAEPMDEERFFRLTNKVLIGIAVAGLLQFVVQIGGISIFAFTGILPDSILIEENFNTAIPFDFGLMKSNGFFLVEPSFFSQFMATGIIIELLYFKRPWAVLILFAGLMASASGTGWMVLGSFVIGVTLAQGRSGFVLALATVAGVAVLLGLVSLVAPSVTNSLWDRTYEFSLPGTSGNERFVTPFMLLRDVIENTSRTVITGIGPGASEAVDVPYKYGVNAPVKVMLEYGGFGLILYLALFLTATRTRRQASLVVPMMVLLLFGGGNQLFSPVLFPVLLFIAVAVLK